MGDTTGPAMSREGAATRTFVELIDSLVEDFDVIDTLTLLSVRAVLLLDAQAAGVLLLDASERLQIVASSNDDAVLLELFQIQQDEGPCLECVATGRAVIADDMRQLSDRWPRFAAESVALGYQAVCAVPLRLRSDVLGCLNLFMTEPGGLRPPDLALAQGLGDVATIAMVQDRAMRDALVRQRQLQHALDSRVVIEQAKGMLAEQADVGMATAFDLLRTYARRRNQKLTDLARDVLDRRVALAELTAHLGATPDPTRGGSHLDR
ncbi:GAF and ANTAR domain-containing protein [Dermatobacter hominis]|uniref:GAF and ANTAR domain-containing protein n=1 Tax=Dermatobacter hominis TaxID=2884263 RepID=UPI001D0F8B73|nr:GAF and ANTAR domain-containing protein [Dermatobacter hominis]UDY34963.1 GAF and ANTAR domain-containing protein [Dermatobacter hominis]